jgi:uncharacterized protein YbaP (TraB family)
MTIARRAWLGALRWAPLAWALLGVAPCAEAASVWAVQGAHNTVYLAASVHVLRPGDTLPAAFDRAYVDSRALMMEIDLENLDPEAGANYVLEHGMLPAGQTLRGVVGEARYGRLEQEAARVGLPLEGLQQLEPWTVALTLTQLEFAKLGLDPDAGVERQLERRAEADHKPIQGLETVEQQLQLLSGMSFEDQARFLDLSASEGDETDAESGEILVAWRTGNERALDKLLRGEYEAFPALYQRLVTDRNHRWVAPIAELLRADHNTMVVVGALHLVGSEGLVALLRSKGYVVRAIE